MELTATHLPTRFAADPQLPHRDVLLDSNAMADELGAALGRRVQSCRLARTKYRVGESLRVRYELRVGGDDLTVALRCFPRGSSPATARRGDPSLALDRLASSAWVFPHDRKLRSLAVFWNNRSVQERLLGVTPDKVTVVSYAPEKAATVRCDHRGSVAGYVKIIEAHHRSVAQPYQILQPELARHSIGAPRLLGVDNELGLVAISHVEGPTLAVAPTSDNWRSCGTATATLHQEVPDSVVAQLARFPRSSPERLANAAGLITTARPDVASGVTQLTAWIEKHTPGVNERVRDVALHGDLHAKNVVVGDDGLGFIDLDQASRGPAVAEIASAIAALHYRDLVTDDATAPLRQAFLDAYREQAPLPADASLRWHVVAALLGERALRAVNRVRLDGLERLPAVIGAALDIAEGATL